MRDYGVLISLLALAACGGTSIKPATSALDDAAWSPPEKISIEVSAASTTPGRQVVLANALRSNGHETFRGRSPRDHIH